MKRHSVVIVILAILSLVLIPRSTAAPAFTDQFTSDLSASPYWRWSSTSTAPTRPTGSANVADAAASDGKILRLTIPGGQPAGPAAGSNLESLQTYHYGTYETRLKTAACPNTEGVINGFFTYQNGGDSNGNGLPDNSEIDFEWLCAEPQSIYLTIWTDYDAATDAHRRVYRKINMSTGRIEYTRYSTTFASSTDLSQSPSENQPTAIPAIPGYDSSAAYYEYGFTWTERRVTMWIVNPANGQRIILWDYQGPAERITRVPAAYMANLWHSKTWAPECCPNALQPPAATRRMDIDWMRYTPPGSTPPTATPPAPTATPAPDANLARGKAVTASSIEAAGLEPARAVDGNAGTRWASAYSDPQWIQVDLGASAALSRVVLRWEAAFGRGYRIETSADGSTWTPRFSTTTGDGGVDDLAISGAGRYVRLTGTARGTQWGYSLWELEVYGSTSVPPTPTPVTSTPIALTNPGFEADGWSQQPSGWGTWGPTAADAAADYAETFNGAHSGSYHLTHYAPTPYEVFTYQRVSGLVNGTYTVRAWVRSTGGQSAVEMQAKEFNGANTILRQPIPALQTWTPITIANVSVTNGQLVIGFYSKGPADTYLHVDDVTLVRN